MLLWLRRLHKTENFFFFSTVISAFLHSLFLIIFVFKFRPTVINVSPNLNNRQFVTYKFLGASVSKSNYSKSVSVVKHKKPKIIKEKPIQVKPKEIPKKEKQIAKQGNKLVVEKKKIKTKEKKPVPEKEKIEKTVPETVKQNLQNIIPEAPPALVDTEVIDDPIAVIQAIISKDWISPKGFKEGTCCGFEIKFSPDGSSVEILSEKTSGILAFDIHARNHILSKNASKFDVPQPYWGQSLNIQMK